jgi:hypothetical protein
MSIAVELAKKHPETGEPGYWSLLEKNARTWAGEMTISAFWVGAGERLQTWTTEYRSQVKDSLLPQIGLPPFVGKEEPRLSQKTLALCEKHGIEKAYAADVPVPCVLNDIVRVRVATKYLDGVAFLAERLQSVAKESGLALSRAREARDSGYYAEHLYFEQEVLYRVDTANRVAKIKCEIQVATQLSTRIWDATHGAYELSRMLNDEGKAWRWDPTDPRFLAAQLGHMIHLADGLIVQLRDRTKGRR